MSNHELQEEEYQSQVDMDLWRRILRHVKPYRRALLGLAFSGLIIAAIDALLPRVTGLVIDEAMQHGVSGDLVRHSLTYFGLVTSMAFLIWAFIVWGGQVATGYAYDVRRAAFARLQELSFSFYDQRPVGWLMARLTSDAERISNIIPWFLLDLCWGGALILGISAMMLHLNTRLALYVMMIVPPLAGVSILFQRRLLHSQRAVRKTNSQITASFNEAIMGVRTTKTLVREEENLGEFQELSGAMNRHSVRNALQAAVYLPIVITLGSIGVGLSLWRGGLQLGGEMTLGTMVAFMQYAAFFYIPIQELAARFTELQAAQASAERLQSLLDTEPEIADSPEVRERIAQHAGGPGAPDDHEAQITEIIFEHVSFGYAKGGEVLHDFNLTVTAGQSVALVGATGSGKSTIVSLLARFYEPTAGVIRINGRDYRERSLGWLQSQLGIVLQAPHLFSGTIRENIRYGRLSATDEEVTAAAQLVNADDFITQLDDGYATDVGEGGTRLSMGQKQLVSLARAVLANPQIFIMDEATSSIDTETERLIQDGIERLLTGRISFIIAHRLSTVRSADRILVIEKGRIVEGGTHAELIGQRGHYHQLYTRQFAREGQARILEHMGES